MVYCDAQWCSNFVLSAVELSDPCSVVEATALTSAERRAILGDTAARIFHVECDCGAVATA